MQQSGKELETLIRLARDGDSGAVGRLVKGFQQTAYSFCYGILGDFHLAEDATQEAFIEASSKLSTLKEPRAFSAWLRRILIKQCDRIVRRQRPRATAHDQLPQRTTPSAADRAADAELQSAMLERLRELPDHERLVTTLFYMDGYSLSRIAHFLEVPEGTVKSRLNASRKRLRESVGTMVERALNASPLPERFADVVVEARIVQDLILPLSERFRSHADGELRQRHGELAEMFAAAGREAALVQAMALAREAVRRQTGMELYASQLVGALFLERGWIAEMRSGEGKTLTIIPAAYALSAQSRTVHVLTPNDYLAKRDAALATAVLQRLGVTVGWIGAYSSRAERAEAHACSILYATPTEAALDHLAGAAFLDVAIVDDADAALIDDAQTRVGIATAQADAPADAHDASAHIEGENYFIANGRVLSIDPTHGRVIEGRILADGLQQTLERRHGLEPIQIPQLAASITLGDFLRRYRQLAGLTGTAMVRRDLLARDYRVEAVAVPTHQDSRLAEQIDRIYASDAERCEAAVAEAALMAKERRAVLLACPSIALCRRIAEMLRDLQIEHGRLDGTPEILAHEAELVAQAGEPGRITVATAVAGRGTDIAIAPAAVGLHVIGVGRHASRRVDLQFLRRAARQGQFGSCRFFMAADDPAVRELALMIAPGEFVEDASLMRRIAQVQIGLEDAFLASRPGYLVVRNAYH